MSENSEQLFVVRLYDMFDGWLDISGELPLPKAIAIWDEKTDKGTHNVCFEDGDYYSIFPANTRMLMEAK